MAMAATIRARARTTRTPSAHGAIGVVVAARAVVAVVAVGVEGSRLRTGMTNEHQRVCTVRRHAARLHVPSCSRSAPFRQCGTVSGAWSSSRSCGSSGIAPPSSASRAPPSTSRRVCSGTRCRQTRPRTTQRPVAPHALTSRHDAGAESRIDETASALCSSSSCGDNCAARDGRCRSSAWSWDGKTGLCRSPMANSSSPSQAGSTVRSSAQTRTAQGAARCRRPWPRRPRR